MVVFQPGPGSRATESTVAPRVKGYDADGTLVYDSDQDTSYAEDAAVAAREGVPHRGRHPLPASIAPLVRFIPF
jgi:hypothetical protein